jgi:two-component system, chemotaxis family, chemotaxis protein CheY
MNTILIVDDSAFMRGILKEALSQYTPTLEVYEADGKITAGELLKKVQPNLVLLDIVMRDNEFEGIEVLKEIKEFYPKVPVIMLTSVGQNAVVEECKNLGAQDYIEKPFDKDNVLKVIEKYLT